MLTREIVAESQIRPPPLGQHARQPFDHRARAAQSEDAVSVRVQLRGAICFYVVAECTGCAGADEGWEVMCTCHLSFWNALKFCLLGLSERSSVVRVHGCFMEKHDGTEGPTVRADRLESSTNTRLMEKPNQ